MLFVLIFIFICTVLLALFSRKTTYYYLIGGILILCAGLRVAGCDRDYYTYLSHFENYQNITLLEPTFKLITYGIHVILGPYPIVLFLIYAFIGVSLKLIAIRKLSELHYLSLLIYISGYFMLHEMTQIRVGIASAFLLLAIKPLLERRWKLFVIYSIVATCFHYSGICILFLILLNSKPNKLFYTLLIPTAIIIYYFNINIITTLPIPIIGDKIRIYQDIKEYGDSSLNQINVFNTIFLLKIFIYYIMIWKYKLLQSANKYFILLHKIFGFSLALFLILSSIPTFAFRISELYGVVIIILIPMLYYIISPNWMARICITMLATFLFFFELFYNKLITVL